MFSTMGRTGRFVSVILTLVAALTSVPTAILHAETAPLFRIFLTDGQALVSYGEYARVSDRVVFSVPLNDEVDTPKLQLISIPDKSVDWAQTEAYATAVRAKRYADARGEEDFTMLAGRVTEALNDIAMAKDPKRRVEMAEEARRNLAAWPAANYGYRAADVAQLVGTLDDVVAEMRVAAGMNQFDLSLVASATPPPPVLLLPSPDLQQSLDAAYRAAVLASDPSEKISVLRSLKTELDAPEAKSVWATALSAKVADSLAAELRVENAYNDLVRRSLSDARKRAARADVKGLQQSIAAALTADARLGGKRPGEMAGLLAQLDRRLDEARRIRLARDSWVVRLEEMKTYRDAIAIPRDRIAGLTPWLKAVRDLSGPNPKYLRPFDDRAVLALKELNDVTPPAELQTAHGLFAASLQMMRQAASLRRTALSSNNIKLAWDAAAAASGALMLAERAADELTKTMSSGPQITTPR
ncbi:MAG: hypothetical protein ABIS06_18930 [Vicinamibacterales bacterium]